MDRRPSRSTVPIAVAFGRYPSDASVVIGCCRRLAAVGGSCLQVWPILGRKLLRCYMSRFVLVAALLLSLSSVGLAQSTGQLLIPPGLDDLPAPAWERGGAGADFLSPLTNRYPTRVRGLLLDVPVVGAPPVKYLFPNPQVYGLVSGRSPRTSTATI